MSYTLPGKLAGMPPYSPGTVPLPVMLGANESFISLPDRLRARIADAVKHFDFNRYPDPMAGGVCAAVARLYGVPQDCVVAGNGSDELISIICACLMEKGQSMMVSAPDFDMYRFYADCYELRVEPVGKADRRADIDGMIERARALDARMVIFSNPCNPTGLGISRDEVLRLVRSVEALVVVDEAYMDFWNESVLGDVSGYDNLLVLKTASKMMGLASMRLGFAIGPQKIIDALRQVKSPYNVNMMTQLVGEIVLSDEEWIAQSKRAIAAAHNVLESELEALAGAYPEEITFLPTVTNFSLIRCRNAKALHAGLMARGIYVRLSMGDYLRVTAGSETENKAFIAAMREILSGNNAR